MERFVSGFSQRTFSPERRAHGAIEDAVADVTKAATIIYENGGDSEGVTRWIEGYKKRWVAYQSAGARTMNWMITGPARFPVDRNNKRLETEMRRYEELAAYRNGVDAWVRRNARRAERAALIATDPGGHKEVEVEGIRVVENTTLERIQIIFPGKPSDDQRAALKRRGFRWAPSAGAWQRKLTNNARHVASSLVQQFAEAAR